MAYTDINSEDRLVQQTFAEHLKGVGQQETRADRKRPESGIIFLFDANKETILALNRCFWKIEP